MTHTSTEQERATFEAWARNQYPSIDLTRDGNDYSKALAKDYWSLWQAARRDPSAPVPQWWKLVPVELLERIQESLGSFVSDQAWSQSDMDTADALDGLLAAAPQPTEAAPVQLPEPAGWIDDGGMVFWNDGRKPNDGEIIYTEQQVRELLANHGIQERST